MKTVVVTGGTRGLGYAMAKQFLDHGCNVIINGRSERSVKQALDQLGAHGKLDYLQGVVGDVADYETHLKLIDVSKAYFNGVDLWVNNAGVDQNMDYFYEHDIENTKNVIDVNLIGVLYGMKAAYNHMLLNGGGYIYNMEGFGSDNRMTPKLSIYGTSKRAVRYASRSMAKEIEDSTVCIGALSPGMVATDLLKATLVGDPEEIARKKRIYNILADKPEDVARFLVAEMLKNKKNNSKIYWLTPIKVMYRFLTAKLIKRTIFED